MSFNIDYEKALKGILYWMGLFSILMFALGVGFAYRTYADCSSAFSEARSNLLVAGLRGHEPVAVTQIFDIDGNLIATACVENRYPVTLDEVSPWVKEGFIATEDQSFYRHNGISIRGILRAVWVNLTTGARQGASTITQQLSRNLFLTADQTIQRKIQEAFIAMEIEKQFEKDEIFEMYLNQIYFGSGAHGIEAAARTYFNGISACELSLAQSAMLVRMVKNPSGYNPVRNPERCLVQRNTAISMMLSQGCITEDQAEEAYSAPLPDEIFRPEIELEWNYFSEYVRQYLVNRYGWHVVYEQGLTVYTTLDPDLQVAAEFAVDSVLSLKDHAWNPDTGEFEDNSYRLRYESSLSYWEAGQDTMSGTPDYVQAALVAIDPLTGYIKAMVGGRSFEHSEFNRAVQARRQPGSAFKPFVYAAALEQGWSPGDRLYDTPVIIDLAPGTWRPRNYSQQFYGSGILRTSLSKSYNVSTVRLSQEIGIESIASLAAKMGIESRIQEVHSLPLGSCMLNPLEITQAYIPFATGGLARDAIAIVRVEDRYGNVLEDNSSPDPGREVLSETATFLINSMLQSVLRAGTAVGSRWYWGGPYSGRYAGGKTGTTSDYADAWFIGFTPDLVAGVWVGYDNHIVRMRLQNNRGQAGSSIALPIWTRFMRITFSEDKLDSTLTFPGPEPNTLEEFVICTITGELARAGCAENTREEYFWKDTGPTEYCTNPLHQSLTVLPDTSIADFSEYDRIQSNLDEDDE